MIRVLQHDIIHSILWDLASKLIRQVLDQVFRDSKVGLKSLLIIFVVFIFVHQGIISKEAKAAIKMDGEIVDIQKITRSLSDSGCHR